MRASIYEPLVSGVSSDRSHLIYWTRISIWSDHGNLPPLGSELVAQERQISIVFDIHYSVSASQSIRRFARATALLCSLCCLLSAALDAPAQQAALPQANAPTLTVTARIVELDVVVTNKKNQIVPGLTAKDFNVFEDGKRQAIRYFEGVSGHALPAGVVIHSTADLARAPGAPVTLLVLDELNTRYEDMSFARYDLKKYLDAQPAMLTQPTELLVVSNSRFQVLCDFTMDRQSLLTALDKHFPEYPWRLMRSGKGGPGAAERLAMSLESLEQIAQSTAGHPGRKSILWVGTGFPAINTNESTNAQAAVIQQAIQHVIGMMRDSRVTLDIIDPTITSAGTVLIQTPDDLDAAEDQNGEDPFEGDVNFQLLAPATGGSLYATRNDIDAEIAESIRDGNNFYTLSYSPKDDGSDKGLYRRIHVQVNLPGLTATTRNGYYVDSVAPPPPTTPATLNLDLKKMAADLGAAANGNLAYTGLAVSAHALSDAPDKQGVVHLAVTVDARGLDFSLLPDGGSKAEVTVLVAGFDRKNRMIGHTIQEMTAHVPPGDSAAQAATFQLPVEIMPHTTRLRVVVRDAVSGRMGTADIQPAP